MIARGVVGTPAAGGAEALAGFDAESVGIEVEVRHHGPLGVWVEGPAEFVGHLGPAWAARLGGAVRGWTVRVDRDRDLVRTEVRGLRWDPNGKTSVLATSTDEDLDPATPEEDIVRARLEIVLDLHERLHQDDARFELRRMRIG